jgi:hypothetical protein
VEKKERMKVSLGNGSIRGMLALVLIAGLAGGSAEIAWVGLIASQASGGAVEVARQVSATVLPGVGALAIAPFAGVAIHLLLSVLLAFAFWRLVWRPFASKLTSVEAGLCGMGSLAAVWFVNFTVVLPALNPAFVTLLPSWATLISKLLFGAAMTAVLIVSNEQRQEASLLTV